ncbi:hypothetical protein HC928_21070 [bacterium]|nr:hypothetical protein [bacterium]
MVKNRILLIFSLLLIGALFTASVAAQEEGVVVVEDGEDVIIGLATILSGEGLVPLGEDIQRGVELALEDRPTVMVGDAEFTIALDVQDDQCSAEGGQAVANRFCFRGNDGCGCRPDLLQRLPRCWPYLR